jgi:predicted nuclease of restriction endonuclease-like (RecB) superfamily
VKRITKINQKTQGNSTTGIQYNLILGDISHVIETARGVTVRSINAAMTAAYWLIGEQIVEFEQKGEKRAAYGEELLERLSVDLGKRYGRGFGVVNLSQMKRFYLLWQKKNFQTLSEESLKGGQISEKLPFKHIARQFPLPWSAYVRLIVIKNDFARKFYESEALRGGWSVRQLDRQINSQFYERTALSKNKAAMLSAAQKEARKDLVMPEEEIKDPLVLEFLGLKDEYSEMEMEEALIKHLESFLLELGGDFCFVGRQKRLRIGDEWYRVDLIFYNRRLKCLVIIDLKLGRFTHADAGQMHLYLNYAREHWMKEGENPPVGLILCALKDESVARYALEGLPNKVMASEYRMALPDEKALANEIELTRQQIQARAMLKH